MKQIFIIGIGMGNPKTMTAEAIEKIKGSQAVIGAKRVVESVSCKDKGTCYAVLPEKIVQWLRQQSDLESAAVLMSGDTGFFSGAKKLAALIREEQGWEVELIPGISSLQYFCAKLQVSWDDVNVVSLHGRNGDFVGAIRTHKKVFLLTDTTKTPAYICSALIKADLGHVLVSVGERLSYERETISTGSAYELADRSFDPLSVVLVENHMARGKQIVTHGIPDEAFIRGKVPMTKEEVRSVTISKLQICEDDVLYDIGAGTGSISVEMALQAKYGQVYAIETKEEAFHLIEKNKDHFGICNLHIVKGTAPEAMEQLPVPDKAFIGGSKGNMAQIIRALLDKNPKIRITVNVIALESLAEAVQAFGDENFEDVDIVQISAARAKELGNYHLMMGENPVFILTGQKMRQSND